MGLLQRPWNSKNLVKYGLGVVCKVRCRKSQFSITFYQESVGTKKMQNLILSVMTLQFFALRKILRKKIDLK